MTATQNKRATLLKKITMSEVAGLKRASGGFKPKTHFGADENGNFPPFLVARIVGIAYSYKIGNTNFGEYLEFHGNFSATNNDGEMFRSPKTIMPEPAAGLLQAAVDGAEQGKGVELAFDFMAVPDAGERGYKFQVVPLMQRDPADPLDALTAQVAEQYALPPAASKQQALPLAEDGAPKADAEAAPEKAAAKKK